MESQVKNNSVMNSFLKALVLIFSILIFMVLLLRFRVPIAFSIKSNTIPDHESVLTSRYHNILLVDKFLPEDFLKFENITVTKSNLSLDERIILSERLYNQSIVNKRQNFTNANWNATQMANYFPSTFDCPHIDERVGSLGQRGKWVCGLDLYETKPRPQECVIYMINDYEDESHEFILEELGNRTDCHILNFNLNELAVKNSTRTQVVSSVGIDVKDDGKNQTLRSLMKTNGHAWLDMLFIDVGGREIPVLQQIMEDFYEVCPIGQLNAALHVAPVSTENKSYLESLDKFTKWFELLENKGFRPFHAETNLLDIKTVGTDTVNKIVVEYSFLNIRGKHLLLSGRNDTD